MSNNNGNIIIFSTLMLYSCIKKLDYNKTAFQSIKVNLYPGTFYGFYKLTPIGRFVFCFPFFNTYKVKSESKEFDDFYFRIDVDDYNENKNLKLCLNKANIKYNYVIPAKTLIDTIFHDLLE